MIDVTVDGDKIVFEVEGWDKLWALRSRLEIPISHIKGARIDGDATKGWWKGVKVGGAQIPGVIVAGTFYTQGRLVFYDAHKSEQTIVVDLDEHENYDALILQVRDPASALKLITDATSNRA
jgi:hypothetical protein